MPTIESKRVKIDAEIVGETERGYLLRAAGKRTRTWLPKDLVRCGADDKVTLPLWLAQEKKLI